MFHARGDYAQTGFFKATVTTASGLMIERVRSTAIGGSPEIKNAANDTP
jgi:hypothetical protein